MFLELISILSRPYRPLALFAESCNDAISNNNLKANSTRVTSLQHYDLEQLSERHQLLSNPLKNQTISPKKFCHSRKLKSPVHSIPQPSLSPFEAEGKIPSKPIKSIMMMKNGKRFLLDAPHFPSEAFRDARCKGNWTIAKKRGDGRRVKFLSKRN